MVVIDKRGWGRTVIVVAVVAGIAGAAWYVKRGRQIEAAQSAAASGAAFAWGAASGAAGSASGVALLPPSSLEPVSADKRPPDIPQAQWDQVVSALRDHPNREQELQRIVAYMRFNRDVDMWMSMKDQPNSAEKAQVAQRVLDALPQRFANQEVTGPEALMLQTAIYNDLIPDEAQRKVALEQARDRLQQAEKGNAALQDKLKTDEARNQEYKKREAEIMARFTAKQIDQAQLEKELDAARVAVFK